MSIDVSSLKAKEKMRSGYTTGTHASAVFKSALSILLNIDSKRGEPKKRREPKKRQESKKRREPKKKDNNFEIKVPLPTGEGVMIGVKEELKGALISVSTKKTDNDDIDVTKGMTIICHISQNLNALEKKLSDEEHNPHEIDLEGCKILVYAGRGLGIVHRDGLKVRPSYPAINPIPMKMLNLIAKELVESSKKKPDTIYTAIEMVDGEALAKSTANGKVGIKGGLSILGTKGIVKPISNEAYIDTIATYISVGEASKCNTLIYTVGNTAESYANKHFAKEESMIVEIGNFVFEAIKMLSGKRFLELYVILSIGKLTKLAQGNKNTHMHYSRLNMEAIKEIILKRQSSLEPELKEKSFNTMRGVLDYLNGMDKALGRLFCEDITNKALEVVLKWLSDIDSKLRSVHVMLLDGEQNILKTRTL